MSIKGIDSQLMITRAADYAKDSAAQLKRGELTQDYLAVQAAADEAVEKTKVAGSQESESVSLLLDAESESGLSGGAGSGGRSKKEDEEEISSSQLVPPGDNLIDIRV